MISQQSSLNSYLINLQNDLENQVKQDSFKPYPFKRTLEQRSDAVGIKVSNQKESFEGLTEAFEMSQGRLLLLGEPGAGKSISLREFAREQVKKRLKNHSNLLPIFVQLNTWNGKENLISWLSRECQIAQKTLEREIDNNNALLLLDGLDELPSHVSEGKDLTSSARDYRADFIKELNQLNNFVPIVITCRRRDYQGIVRTNNEPLNLNNAVLLKRLINQEIIQHLEQTLQEKDKTILWNIIKKNRVLLGLIRTPFLLEALLLTYKEKISQHGLGRIANFGTTEQIFEIFFETGYEREKEKKKGTIPCSLEELEESLGQIAVKVLSNQESDGKQFSLDSFCELINEPREIIKSIINLFKNLYILSSTDNEQICDFRHPLIRDYFTFRYANRFLRNQYNEEERSQIKKIDVVRALSRIDNLQSVDLLADLIRGEDPNKDVRYEAAKALGQLTTNIYFSGYENDFSEKSLISRPLNKFTESDIYGYFQQAVPDRRVMDSDVEEISEFSCGIPFVVEKTAAMWAKGVSLKEIIRETGTTHDEIVTATCERFLVHCVTNQQDLRVIYILAMMPFSEKGDLAIEFLQHLLDTNNLQSRLEELYERYSFISLEEKQLDYQHKTFFREYLLKPEQRKSSLTLEISQKARNYFLTRFSQKEHELRDSKQLLENKEATSAISNLIYYWFWVSEDEGWKKLIPYLVQGWYYEKFNWTQSLLRIPTLFPLTRRSRSLLQIFEWGLPSLSLDKVIPKSIEDQSVLLNELENHADREQIQGDEEWLAIVLLKQGNLFLEQKRYDEAEKKYLEALGCLPEAAQELKTEINKCLRTVRGYAKANENSQDRLEENKQTQIEKEIEDRIEHKFKDQLGEIRQLVENLSNKSTQDSQLPNAEASQHLASKIYPLEPIPTQQVTSTPIINQSESPSPNNSDLNKGTLSFSFWQVMVLIGVFMGSVISILFIQNLNTQTGSNPPIPTTSQNTNETPSQPTVDEEEMKLIYENAIQSAKKGVILSAMTQFCRIPESSSYFDAAATKIEEWLNDPSGKLGDPKGKITITNFLEKKKKNSSSCPMANVIFPN